MKILVEVTHPAHAHFFKHPLELWWGQGHDLLVTSRTKDCTTGLLGRIGVEHLVLSSQSKSGMFSMVRELAVRNRALSRVVRKFKPDVLCGLGGTSAAQVGFATGRPSVVFYDTESARLQNLLTYPFATLVCVPECYTGRVPRRRTARYRGYHELSYLHPDYFAPDRDVALANGLSPRHETYLLRLVSWRASHDVGIKGWSVETLMAVVDFLSQRGKVLISAEGPLPAKLETLRYHGAPDQLHHVLAFSRLYVGESATMASEASMLGVPAIYAAPSYRGYVSDQERRYGFVRFVERPTQSSIVSAMAQLFEIPRERIAAEQARMLSEVVDVARFVCDKVTDVVKWSR